MKKTLLIGLITGVIIAILIVVSIVVLFLVLVVFDPDPKFPYDPRNEEYIIKNIEVQSGDKDMLFSWQMSKECMFNGITFRKKNSNSYDDVWGLGYSDCEKDSNNFVCSNSVSKDKFEEGEEYYVQIETSGCEDLRENDSVAGSPIEFKN